MNFQDPVHLKLRLNKGGYFMMIILAKVGRFTSKKKIKNDLKTF